MQGQTNINRGQQSRERTLAEAHTKSEKMPQQERDKRLHTGPGLFPEGCAWAHRPSHTAVGWDGEGVLE